MQLEGYIEFENEIPVVKECLGKEYPIEISGITGILVTPVISKHLFDEGKLGPLKSPDKGDLNYADHFQWGSVYSWPKGHSTIKACKILFYEIEEKGYEETAKKIAEELGIWRKQLIDNISLFLQCDYRGSRRAKLIKSYGLGEFGLFVKKDGANEKVSIHKPQNRTISLGGTTVGFDENELTKVLVNTSKGKTPLLPFYFIFDAERANFEENYRRSILDSATAVEICFSYKINELLPFNADINKYLLKKHNALKTKRELLKALNFTLPYKTKEYSDKLEFLRNRVIHGGYIPQKNEATTVYRIAKETIYTLLPKMYE